VQAQVATKAGTQRFFNVFLLSKVQHIVSIYTVLAGLEEGAMFSSFLPLAATGFETG
jgi:hypothetical protein